MLRPLLLTATLLAALPAQAETRCGWYHNPGPGNVILEDADGQWWISVQGSAPSPGFEEAYTAAFDNRTRIDYSGNVTQRYGYSCACAEGVFDASRGQYENVLSISRLTEIPLARCVKDPALPTP
jgi:Protein of unknown function (DUF4087)